MHHSGKPERGEHLVVLTEDLRSEDDRQRRHDEHVAGGAALVGCHLKHVTGDDRIIQHEIDYVVDEARRRAAVDADDDVREIAAWTVAQLEGERGAET